LYEGVGYYKGQAALGVSFRKTSSTGRWSISGGVSVSRGGVAAKVGATQVLGDD
jgi:hypothetical protein